MYMGSLLYAFPPAVTGEYSMGSTLGRGLHASQLDTMLVSRTGMRGEVKAYPNAPDSRVALTMNAVEGICILKGSNSEI